MTKTFLIFCVYWLIELAVAVIVYYCACALGIWAFKWEGMSFWVAGIPVLIGILFAGCILFLVVGGLIAVVKWNWKEAAKDIQEKRQKKPKFFQSGLYVPTELHG